MDIADFDFDLPPELIAQEPPPERGGSRLLVLDRATGEVRHHRFDEIHTLLHAGDLLVVNDTRVFPARLLGTRLPGGGAAECLLVRRVNDDVWECLVHPGQRLRPGSRLVFESAGVVLHGEILERRFHGRRTVRFSAPEHTGMSLDAIVDAIGHIPLPPYIKRDDRESDRDRYQTVYAQARGSIAAPTAGLHFTPGVLDRLDARGIERTSITLHVGYGTFQPVRVDEIEQHRVEAERYDVSPAAAAALERARRDGRRVIAVGTTTVRTLETLALRAGPAHGRGGITAGSGETDLFIHPGHTFRLVGGLITNFHLPRSSLLMLVAAFAGRERLLAAYRTAVAERYRFYSYGDATLII